jgi:eukaryotic-like serine/threonine-protein kinase
MSPEQIKGKEADPRSDLFAFGATLYEMATGERAFPGKSQISVASAILEKEPEPISTKQPLVPAALDRVVGQCLAKDPDERFQSAHDVGLGLKWVGAAASEGRTAGEESAGHRPSLQRALPWALAGVLAVALIASLVLGKFAAPAPQRSPVLADIPPPRNTAIGQSFLGPASAVVSPDGKRLAFSATDANGVTKLYVQPLASKEAKAIAGTENAAWPFWSPDGGSLGFFADQKLKTVNLGNGNVQVLADDLCAGYGGAWSPSGTILFTPNCGGPLNEIPSSGGKPSPATNLANGKGGNGLPVFLPDGRHFLDVSNPSNILPTSIWMGSLGSSEQRLILKDARSPEFASKHLLFIRDNRVFAQPFDPANGKLSGEATALVDARSYSVSGSGVLAYQGGSRKGRLEWFDRSGNPLGGVGPAAVYVAARISPDGERILADVWDPQSETADLWSYPASGGPGTRLTFGSGMKLFSAWSPDGKYIAYQCPPKDKQMGGGICRKPADGSGTAENLLTFGPGVAYGRVLDWSPDGRYLSFDEWVRRTARYEVWALPLFGGRKPFQPVAVNASQDGGNFSPNGRWLAYFSNETGRDEVYVVPFPGPGGKFQISQNGGRRARWDREGHLYFLRMGNRLMEADLSTHGASLHVKAIHPLFPLNLESLNFGPAFDVNADGSRFLVVTSADPNASKSIGLILDWQAKLKGKQ